MVSVYRVLHQAVAALKRIRRTGWVERGVAAPESVADHSFGVVALTLLRAEELCAAGTPVDVVKAIRMAVLHDLAEHETGDLSPRQRRALFGDDGPAARAAQRAAESRVVRRLLADAPPVVRAAWLAAHAEYCAGATPEAALVRDADRLECVLQAGEYEAASAPARLIEFHGLAREIGDERLRALLTEGGAACDADTGA